MGRLDILPMDDVIDEFRTQKDYGDQWQTTLLPVLFSHQFSSQEITRDEVGASEIIDAYQSIMEFYNRNNMKLTDQEMASMLYHEACFGSIFFDPNNGQFDDIEFWWGNINVDKDAITEIWSLNIIAVILYNVLQGNEIYDDLYQILTIFR